MKYLIALIASLFLIGPVMADSQTTVTTASGLTDQQKAELAAQAAKMAADNASGAGDVSSAKRVKEWVDIGTAIGSGLASTARELGVAANDFIKTPVGKLTAFIIIWHFLGASLVHIVLGTTWLIVAGTGWYILYRRISYKVTETFFEPGKGPNGAKKTVVKSPIPVDEGAIAIFIVGALIILAVGLVTIWTF